MEPSALLVICKGEVPLPVDVQDASTSASKATLLVSNLPVFRCEGSANFNVCSSSTSRLLHQLVGIYQSDEPEARARLVSGDQIPHVSLANFKEGDFTHGNRSFVPG